MITTLETTAETVARSQRFMATHTEALLTAADMDMGLIDLAALDATIRKLLTLSHNIKDEKLKQKWPVKALTGKMGRTTEGVRQ